MPAGGRNGRGIVGERLHGCHLTEFIGKNRLLTIFSRPYTDAAGKKRGFCQLRLCKGRSGHVHTAIDMQGLARDVAACRGYQEEYGLGDVVRGA